MLIYRPLLCSLSEVHDELGLLGIDDAEIHALVDDLDLRPLVKDYFYTKYAIARARNRSAGDLIKQIKNVYQPKTIRKEVTGRLFEDY